MTIFIRTRRFFFRFFRFTFFRFRFSVLRFSVLRFSVSVNAYAHAYAHPHQKTKHQPKHQRQRQRHLHRHLFTLRFFVFFSSFIHFLISSTRRFFSSFVHPHSKNETNSCQFQFIRVINTPSITSTSQRHLYFLQSRIPSFTNQQKKK